MNFITGDIKVFKSLPNYFWFPWENFNTKFTMKFSLCFSDNTFPMTHPRGLETYVDRDRIELYVSLQLQW